MHYAIAPYRGGLGTRAEVKALQINNTRFAFGTASVRGLTAHESQGYARTINPA